MTKMKTRTTTDRSRFNPRAGGPASRFALVSFLGVFAASLTACGGPETQPPELNYPELAPEARASAQAALQTALETLPSGETQFWTAEDGSGGSITPRRILQTADGRYCRVYRETIFTPGVAHRSADRRACRDETAVWR